MAYEKGADGVPAWNLAIRKKTWIRWRAASRHTVGLLPNRSYRLSSLVKTDWDRPVEVNVGMRQLDASGREVMAHYVGLPNKTRGWRRWDWEFHADPQATQGQFIMDIWEFPTTGKLAVSDVVLIELPARPLVPYAKGEGATFRGGPGNLPMRVEGVQTRGRTIEVRTTGVLYTFDTEGNTIAARQLLEQPRDVAVWRSSLPLAGLQVLRQTPTECVLANDRATFGVQCDGLVMIVPHAEATFTCQSKLAGDWNRLYYGNLLVIDAYGGLSATPDIPPGTGRQPRVDIGEWTAGRVFPGSIDFAGVNADSTFISKAAAGFEVSWHLTPGERLGISVFPPKPYPWKESFRSSWILTNRGDDIKEYPGQAATRDMIVLWDFLQRTWAMSWGREHVAYDDADLTKHTRAIQQAGIRALIYMSPWFYYSRDPDEFAGEVRRLRDRYGFSGVYYDGLPADDWVAAYEIMRLTREAYPSGTIILHNTYPPPLLNQDIELPAISSYADVDYTGELITGRGVDWPYARYMVSNYRKGNTVGVLVGGEDTWQGLTRLQQELVLLRYNARHQYRAYPEEYRRILEDLKQLWEERGSDPEFYEKYYLPRWHELTKGMLPD
jgi:hypothetical protein